jgi:DNA helicase IV
MKAFSLSDQGNSILHRVLADKESNQLQIGDRVTHYKYGQGVVERLVAGGLAEVRFKRRLEYVQQENLRSPDAEKRAARARREAQLTEAANRRAKQEEKERQRKIELEQAEARRELVRQIQEHMISSYRTVDQFFNRLDSAIMSDAEFRDLKTQFVKHWLAESQPKSTARRPLYVDDGQARAIATVEGHVQVVARAGSGKTTTVVNRALFLIRHCNVPPGSILLLAFNRKAALEIQRKVLEVLVTGAKAAIEEEFKALRRRDRDKRYSPLELEARAVAAVRSKAGVSLPHALTFHALAYAIVHPEETLLYDDVEANSLSLSGTIQRVIDRLLHKPETHAMIRALMLDHFRSDWDSIVAGKYDLGRDEFLSYRRSIPHQTLNGEAVKSYGEKLIADFFFEHDVAYKYEKNHWWHRRNYRPDFTLHTAPDEGLIVEYFGLKGDPEYDEMTEEKRAYWRTKKSWHLVEVYPADVARENGELAREKLRSSLAKAGIRCAKLSEDEIWSRVRERAVDRFSRSVRSFVGKCRQKSIQPMNLRSMIDGHQASGEAEERFLEIAHRVYVEYLDEISRNNQEDFSGLLQRASDLISDGRTVFENRFGVGDLGALEYIFVDEYQDFSELFHRLLDEVRRHAPEARLFCVGDDWQAINSFAGSELRFFTEFSRYIGENHRLELSTNYRSDKAVVSVGNELMKGLGRPARAQSDAPGAVIVADLADFAPSFIESERHRGDGLTPGILRIVQRSLGEGRDVVLLQRQQYIPAYINMDAWGGGRRLRDPTFLDLIRSYFPEELAGRIQQSTVHKYKGLEKPTVILLDAVARSFPLVHPDWIFTRVLGDSPDQLISEERRLFYVAVTRAVHELVLVTRGKEISPFLEPLLRLPYVNRLDWDRYIPVSGEAKHVALQVGNTHPKSGDGTFAIRDLLKNDGYKWQTSKWQHWVKEMPEQSLDFESIKNETWATQADGVEVRLVDDHGQLRERHVIRRGEWRKL